MMPIIALQEFDYFRDRVAIADAYRLVRKSLDPSAERCAIVHGLFDPPQLDNSNIDTIPDLKRSQ